MNIALFQTQTHLVSTSGRKSSGNWAETLIIIGRNLVIIVWYFSFFSEKFIPSYKILMSWTNRLTSHVLSSSVVFLSQCRVTLNTAMNTSEITSDHYKMVFYYQRPLANHYYIMRISITETNTLLQLMTIYLNVIITHRSMPCFVEGRVLDFI